MNKIALLLGGLLRRIAVLFVFFFMILSGTCCQNPKHPTFLLSETPIKRIWIDASFSIEEQNEIIRAYKTVECSTNYSIIRFEFSKDAAFGDYHRMKTMPSILVINAVSSDPRIKESDKRLSGKGKHTVGLYLSQEEIPTVLLPKDRLRKSDFYQVVVHEAIHSSLNILKHSESKKAVMFYAMDETSARDITEDDLKFICNSYECDAKSFNVCKGD